MAYVLDQANTNVASLNANLKFTDGTNQQQFFAESFVPSVTATIGKVTLKLAAAGTISGLMTCSIRADNSGVPASSDLVAAGTVNTSVLTGSYADVDFIFSTAQVLTSGTTYWICLTSDIAYSGSNFIQWAVSGNGLYPSGIMKYFLANTGAWTSTSPTDYTGDDLLFKEYYSSSVGSALFFGQM